MQSLFNALGSFFTGFFDPVVSFFRGIVDYINQGVQGLVRLVEFIVEIFEEAQLLVLVPWPAFVSTAFLAVIALVALRVLIDLL